MGRGNRSIWFWRFVITAVLLGIFPSDGLEARLARAQGQGSASLPSEGDARVSGFRSADFGMDERQVLKAIYKDFKVSKSQIIRKVHPTEKTVSFEVPVQNLIPDTGPARVFYIFGYKSKKLIQVNLVWGKPITPHPDAEAIVNAANQLRNHFVSQGFPRKDLIVNQKIPNRPDSIVVFRGIDIKGRVAILLLENPQIENAPPNQNITLKLSYIANPTEPDVFRIKEGEF